MHVLITFNPKYYQDNFEGSRLRKTIKGALEMVGIPYTNNPIEYYDIVHLLSCENEISENQAIDKNIPIIVSALSTESDPKAKYFDFKSKDGKITNTLSTKATRFLNNASLIIVPTESCVELLRRNGINTPIEVMLPGINISRFDFSRKDEKEIFFRYFKESPGKKLVISNGDYDNIEGINCFIQAAMKCPSANFYYFGQAKRRSILKFSINKLIKKAPSNCHFSSTVTDDVYRSALLNADLFLFTSYQYVGVVSLLEAMASKCQLIVREQALFEGLIENEKTGYVAKFSETLISLTKDFLDGKLKSTVLEAYKLAKTNSLESVGNKLQIIYENELLKKEGK